MKHTLQQLFCLSIVALLLLGQPLSVITAHAATTTASKDDPVYTTLRTIDLGTFNEYRYKITEQFFILREYFEINNELDVKTLQNMAKLADAGYKYLPNNLKNQNYLREFLIDIQKGVKSPSNEILYTEIISSLAAYLENVEIQSVQGQIEATPLSGNAPITTTFRAKVNDPSGTQIASGNYTWWIDSNGQRIVIGRGSSLNYTFREEGKYSVFLDVTSSHKNVEGFTDVLPFRSRVDITVNEKVATLVIKVNGENVLDNQHLKFTPNTADYGLLFDATSSIPTSGTKFSKTEWNFGNGITRSYSGSPKIERIRYATQGDYDVTLRLTTNEGKVVTKEFLLSVHDPIATIEVNRADGYIGDSFTFSAKSAGIYKDLTYSWEILNIDNDTVIYQKTDKLFTYSFTDKGRYNVRLKVRQSSGEIDQDTRIVYVTSQTPIAEFESKIASANKPNRIYFDASRSFDPDLSDDGNLKYSWFIDGNRVNLEQSNANGSVGYYVFDSVGTHSVNLEVTDLDGITATKKSTVAVTSILSVEMFAFPRVVPRNGFIKFVAESPEASVYEWNFGDGKTTGGNFDKVTHTYETSGAFDVTLKVSDAENNTNTYTRKVFVSDSDEPFSVLDVSYDNLETPQYDATACNGEGAYIVNRVQNLNFNAIESIDINGQATGLEYSWKIGQTKFATTPSVIHRFDETGCFPVKLTVKSINNGKTHSSEAQVEVRNLNPTLASLSVQVEDPNTDPLIVRVSAQGAIDPDGIIQSYLWYYYTDIDTNPQDFRSTATPSTAFVLPKVTGNYYFVAILKDNNEARVTSEEITGSRYFTTITGDNINTPIIELAVTDNSTVIGEEVTFTAKATNILGQVLDKETDFSWDFDGDGFYDTQTKEPTTSYIYKKSGEFYAKVKVKYRGISSTRNVTMNVSNKLVPDFDYISIGNTFIFFDNSSGQVDTREWDLGDGTKKTESSFSYTYNDKAPTHTVKLKITEGTTVKEVEKDVSKNFKNILKTREGGLIVFTSPEQNASGSIVLDNASQRVFAYMGESDETVESYVIDYDIEQDSDLNGGMDDDENNKGTASYISGNVTEIPLTAYKIQKIRLYTKDAAGKILASQDILIEKSYIEEVNINPDTIIFEGVTESEKQKIEALKAILVTLPQQQKLEALSYVQKLQENWNDATEKTRTILDFENYIFELKLTNEDEVITLLESLLVEGQEDQSAKQIVYQALVNLIPKEIVCTVETGTCYENLLSKLEDIRNSDDVEANKVIGKSILETIATTDLLTSPQKIDFKALLYSLVYGNVEDIPDEEKQEVIAETPTGSTDTTGSMFSILFTLLTWLGYIFLAFLGLVGIFYLAYLILNKDKSITFTEFVSRKTSFSKDENIGGTTASGEDILADFLAESPTSSDIFSSKASLDPLVTPKIEVPKTQTPVVLEKKANDEVPDWLKGNFSSVKEETVKTPEKPILPPVVLPPKTEAPKIVEVKEVIPAPEAKTFDLEKETQLVPEENVPDWLKGSFSPEAPVKKEEATLPSENIFPAAEKTMTETLPKKQEAASIEVPDWLKGSFDTPEASENLEKALISEVPLPVTPKVSVNPKAETPKTVPKKETLAQTEKTETVVKKPASKAKTETSKAAPKKAEKKEELWDDGMKIPDWLKSDDEK